MLQDAGVDNAFHRRQLLEYCRQLTLDIAQRQREGGAQGRGASGAGASGAAADSGIASQTIPKDRTGRMVSGGGWADWRGGGDHQAEQDLPPPRTHSIHPLAGGSGKGAVLHPAMVMADEEVRAASVSWQGRSNPPVSIGESMPPVLARNMTARMGSVPNLGGRGSEAANGKAHGDIRGKDQREEDASGQSGRIGNGVGDSEEDSVQQGTQQVGTAEKVVGALKNLTIAAAKVWYAWYDP